MPDEGKTVPDSKDHPCMAIHSEIAFDAVDSFYLDPKNPRLGRANTARDLSQDEVLALMRDWSLEEIAVSYLQSGIFWPQEALIVVNEERDGQMRRVVVEGNRRLAALLLLREAAQNRPISPKWADLVDVATPNPELFDRVPFITADSRDDVEAFLGFRHVTGIKEWKPAEKAEYIAKLIDERGLSYQEVMRTIGSKTEAVRRNYVAYRVFLQLEDAAEDESLLENVEEKFSVLFLSLRERGVQRYLEVDIRAEPENAQRPVPEDKIQHLIEFASWLFGTSDKAPLVTDSRLIGRFSKILESPEAVDYLRSSDDPDFEVASRKSGADEAELIDRIVRATDEIEQALSTAHLYAASPDVVRRMRRFHRSALELLSKFEDLEQTGGLGG